MDGFGSILKDYLEYYKISQTDFADRLNISFKHLNNILNGNANLSSDLILAISLITDIDPKIILHAEQKKKIHEYLYCRYGTEKEIDKFLNSFYVKEMARMDWLKLNDSKSNVEIALNLLNFLNVTDFDMLDDYYNKRILYKKCNSADNRKIFLWIHRCDNKVVGTKINSYDSKKFNDLLCELEKERIKPYNSDNLIRLFNKYGIYLVIEDALEGTKIRGCMKVMANNPCIYLTKYYKEKSSFYFALYHELCHVKTDYNRAKNKSIIDDEDYIDKKALNLMINDNVWNDILKNVYNREEICKENNIPLCFMYSRLAREGYIKYTNNDYLNSREKI